MRSLLGVEIILANWTKVSPDVSFPLQLKMDFRPLINEQQNSSFSQLRLLNLLLEVEKFNEKRYVL